MSILQSIKNFLNTPVSELMDIDQELLDLNLSDNVTTTYVYHRNENGLNNTCYTKNETSMNKIAYEFYFWVVKDGKHTKNFIVVRISENDEREARKYATKLAKKYGISYHISAVDIREVEVSAHDYIYQCYLI